MLQDEMVKEAAECRKWAVAFAGQPEQPFLLRLADEFERLVEERERGTRRDDRQG